MTRWSAECRRNAPPLGSSFRSRKRSKPSRPLPTPWSACEPTFRNLPIGSTDLSRRNQPRPSTPSRPRSRTSRPLWPLLATRAEIDSLDGSLQGLARDLEKRPTGKSILTLVGAIDTLHGQVADLSDDLKQEFHVRLASEIESIERKIDRLTQNGVDRSVIDFLSSQIVDLRHDLASRAEPQQIERLSDAVAHVAGQIGELRSEQVGQADFTALRAALEKVCGALAKSVAQQANDVPDQILRARRQARRPGLRAEQEPADLEPIATRVADLATRITEADDRRFEDSQIVLAQFDRLSAQIGSALETSRMSAAPLWERFDKLESGLREIGARADASRPKRSCARSATRPRRLRNAPPRQHSKPLMQKSPLLPTTRCSTRLSRK